MTKTVIVADWGTSSFRAWSVAENSLRELVRVSVGVKDIPTALEKTDFLQHHLAPFLCEADVVEGIGMISSTMGIRHTPYLPVPASLDSLLSHRVDSGISLTDASGRSIPVRLGPGVSCRRGSTEDIMRGEEFQVLAATTDGLVICPGSHSKWVQVVDATVVAFTTFLTGELFASLSTQTSLRESVTEGRMDSESWDSGFRDGLDQPADVFSRELFSVRAGWVKDGNKDWAAGYLSGLCVGLEWHLGLSQYSPEKIHLIGSDVTLKLYEMASLHFGVSHQSHPDSVAPEVFFSPTKTR